MVCRKGQKGGIVLMMLALQACTACACSACCSVIINAHPMPWLTISLMRCPCASCESHLRAYGTMYGRTVRFSQVIEQSRPMHSHINTKMHQQGLSRYIHYVVKDDSIM